MVNAETKTALNRLRWGTIMLWAGVFVWAPFIILKAAGYTPSFLWFLAFHLTGVVGGSRLRSSARKELSRTTEGKSYYRTAGHGLILIGILAWLPGIYQNLTAKTPFDVAGTLPFHLTGVLGGATLLVVGAILHRRRE